MSGSKLGRWKALAVALAFIGALVAGGCSVEVSCGPSNGTSTTVVSTASSEGPPTSQSLSSTSLSSSSLPSTTTSMNGGVSTSLVTSSTATTSTLPDTSTTTTTEALSSAETRLPDGTIKAMGFIDRVWEAGGTRYLSIDYAEMLTGEEARQAAIEAGDLSPGEDLPNDYYIRNVNPKKRQFRVSLSVAITTSTRWAPHEGMGAPCSWADFMSFWGPGPLPEGDRHLHAVPWWIVRDGDLVIRIDEQYLP